MYQSIRLKYCNLFFFDRHSVEFNLSYFFHRYFPSNINPCLSSNLMNGPTDRIVWENSSFDTDRRTIMFYHGEQIIYSRYLEMLGCYVKSSLIDRIQEMIIFIHDRTLLQSWCPIDRFLFANNFSGLLLIKPNKWIPRPVSEFTIGKLILKLCLWLLKLICLDQVHLLSSEI